MKTSWWLFVVVAVVIAGVSCGGPTPTPTAFPTPKLVFVPTPVTPTPPRKTTVSHPGTTKVNLDEIAPPGRDRDLLIMNCGNCHSFVCALRGQRTEAHWEMVRRMHESRHWVVLEIGDSDSLFNYLERNFNEQNPVPLLPPALDDQGCTTPALR